MAYLEWGEADNPRVLVCVHGLTRNGRDFDFLARHLARHYRVICPDVAGRGRSDWLAVKADYAIPNYVADLVTLIARLDVPSVHWVGTSMGGLIGMVLASLPGSPIERLVLNDVGPMVSSASIARIAEYVGEDPLFATLDEAEAYVRAVSAPFGDLTHAQWRHLTDSAVKPVEDGFRFRYDPGIAEPFRMSPLVEDVSLWDVYDRISCPTLVVRGAESDLLLAETVAEMTTRGPRARAVEIPRVGHAPMLLDDAQIAVVADFLLASPRR
ncbi:MAG: alpha/beta hydrolase [Zoogloeaceae bacterium]|nr:alpha/beta hydrolase [Zoogloeaceae bacterium]